MFPIEKDDNIVDSPSISGASSNSIKTKAIDDNASVSEEIPQEDKNTDSNKDKDSSINKEGRVGFLIWFRYYSRYWKIYITFWAFWSIIKGRHWRWLHTISKEQFSNI